MRVVVIGAGQVGRSIAGALQADHDVVVIERDRTVFESLEPYDVLAIQGNGASLNIQRQAEIAKADLVIASTDIDEVNIVACAASKHQGAAFTIARVHEPDYIDTWEQGRLGVDFMVCSELITSETIAQLIGVPAARDIHTFAEGRIMIAELPIAERSPFAGRRIHTLQLPPSAMIASLIREGRVIIPKGDDQILAGDLMVTLGTPTALGELNRRAGGREAPQRVVILGGGRIGFRLALKLESQGLRPVIVEADVTRSRWLAEALPHCQVFQSDATDLQFLEHERIGDCHIGVSVMDKDERNLLSALLLKRLGVGTVIAGVAEPHYIEVFERVGIDIAVSARKVVADEIIRFTRRRISGISVLEGERAEIIEMDISDDSPLAGVPLRESGFPQGAIIGAIVRDDQILIPRGKDRLRPGDKVIVFTEKASVSEVESRL